MGAIPSDEEKNMRTRRVKGAHVPTEASELLPLPASGAEVVVYQPRRRHVTAVAPKEISDSRRLPNRFTVTTHTMKPRSVPRPITTCTKIKVSQGILKTKFSAMVV